MRRRHCVFVTLAFLLASAASIPLRAQETPAQDPPTLDDLSPLVGVWKTTINADGEDRTQYNIFRKRQDLNALAQWVLVVHPESQALERVGFGFLGAPRRTNQIQGLFFNSDGFWAESIGSVTDSGLMLKGFGTMPNGTRVAADIEYVFGEGETFGLKWTGMMAPTGYSRSGFERKHTKTEYKNLRELARGEGLSPLGDAEIADALAPLKHLLGAWSVTDSEGTVQLELNWHARGMGRWMVERWETASGRNGINVTGVDPTTGRLTLWGVGANAIGRAGYWDVLSDNMVGQVQGMRRLIREHQKTDSEELLRTHWQRLDNGRYVDTQQRYVAKRTLDGESLSAASADESATSEPIDYGKPKLFARIEYMKVPEGGDGLYLKVERVWRKIHQARRDAGLITNWMVTKVNRRPGAEGDYQYAVIHLMNSLERSPQANFQQLVREAITSDEDKEILAQTGDSRELLRYDLWDMVAVADEAKFDQPGFDPSIWVGFMQSKDEAKHWELEQSIWRKIWAQQVSDGHLWNWQLWRRRTGEGHNFVAVHLRPKGKTDQPRPVMSPEVLKKALPDMSSDEVVEKLSMTPRVRDMVGGETWTIVESLDRDD